MYCPEALLCFKTIVASRARWYTPCYFACWGVSPIPTEHTINCVATLPLGAENHGMVISVPEVFLSLFQMFRFVKVGQY